MGEPVEQIQDSNKIDMKVQNLLTSKDNLKERQKLYQDEEDNQVGFFGKLFSSKKKDALPAKRLDLQVKESVGLNFKDQIIECTVKAGSKFEVAVKFGNFSKY